MLFVASNLVPDHASDSSAADGPYAAAATQDCATQCACTGADGSIPVAFRHVAASTQ
jgi:hypothetical protein